MARILVLQHGAGERTGRLGATLRDHGFVLDIRRLDRDPAGMPADLDGFAGVLTLGGPRDLDTTPEWMPRELDLLADAVQRDLCVVGVGLGHLLLAKALGGEIAPAETPEVGFVPVEMLFHCYSEVLMAGVPWRFHALQAHAWQVAKAPPSAQVLQKSAACPVQSIRVGVRSIGVQYHLEADRPMALDLVDGAHGLRERTGLGIDEFEAQAQRHDAMFARVGERIALNLATLAFPFDRLLAG